MSNVQIIGLDQTPPPRPRLNRMNGLREILDLIVLVGAIYALVNLATVRFIVRGVSMEPTFRNDQFLIISRANYLLGEPERGDIVVFHAPGNANEDYIKRLIGLPGETVEIFNTEVYVNGEKLYEPYIREACRPASCPDNTWTMGEGEYFLMGDNRNRSSDSRAFTTPVRREQIVGEAIVRYWPPTDWGLISRIDFPVD